MKKQSKSIIAAIAACLTISTIPSNAGSRESLIQQTHVLEKSSESLRQEFGTHYNRTPQFQALMACLRQVERSTTHIHGLAHDPRTFESPKTVGHIRDDIDQLDKTVHELHELVDGVERGRSGLSVKGKTGHVHRDLAALNNTLHAMRTSSNARILRMKQEQSHRHNHQHGQKTQKPAPFQRYQKPQQPTPVTRYQKPQQPTLFQRYQKPPSNSSRGDTYNPPYRQNYSGGNSRGGSQQGSDILRSILQRLSSGGGR